MTRNKVKYQLAVPWCLKIPPSQSPIRAKCSLCCSVADFSAYVLALCSLTASEDTLIISLQAIANSLVSPLKSQLDSLLLSLPLSLCHYPLCSYSSLWSPLSSCLSPLSLIHSVSPHLNTTFNRYLYGERAPLH